MAITKRTRFEVLRRDDHTCQYCGEKAPDVILHVDHVIPSALGGSDKPDNLVAACKDCNSGKSSISPDSPSVTAVARRSAEYVLAVANRGARMDADFHALAEYGDDFWIKWDDHIGHHLLPEDWRRSIKSWWHSCVPLSVLTYAIEVAAGNRDVPNRDRYRYFAGVVWRQIEDYDMRYPAEANRGRIYSEGQLEEHGISGWRRGYQQGIEAQERKCGEHGEDQDAEA